MNMIIALSIIKVVRLSVHTKLDTFRNFIISQTIGNRTIHLMKFHLSSFYLETGYCHGRVRVRARVSVLVKVTDMVGVRMK